MALTAYVWVPGETITAAKLNTISDDLLELDAVAGFANAQYGTVVFTNTTTFVDITVSAMSARAIIHNLGFATIGAIGGVMLWQLNSTTIRAYRHSADDLGGGGLQACLFCIEDPRG